MNNTLAIIILSSVAIHNHEVTEQIVARNCFLCSCTCCGIQVLQSTFFATGNVSQFETLSCIERFCFSSEDALFHILQALDLIECDRTWELCRSACQIQSLFFSSPRLLDTGWCCQKCVNASMSLKLPLFLVHCRVDAVVTTLVSENCCGW